MGTLNEKSGAQPPGFRFIILIILAISIVPLLIVGGLILYEFEANYHRKTYDHLTVLLKKHSRTIDGFLVDRLGDIRVLARSHAGEKFRDNPFMQKELSILRDEYGGVFVDLGLIDPDGIQQEYFGPLNLTKANYAGTTWFSEVQKKEYFLSDVFTGLRGSPHFIVAVKVMLNGKGWILRATVDFKAFNALVSNIRIGSTGFAFIVNRHGELQTQPGVDLTPDRRPFKNILNSPLPAHKVIIKEESTGLLSGKIFAYTPLNNGNWVLCFQQELSDAFSALSKTRTLAILLAIASIVVVTLAALFLTKRMKSRVGEVLLEKDKMSDQVVEAGRLASIGELAAGIAHEVNNPVAIMVEEAGWIQDLLAEDDLTSQENMAEIVRAAAQIRTQGRRCKEITQKLLSFARKTDPRTKEIQINELISEVVSLIDQKARYANVKVQVNLSSDLPLLVAPASELQQVLLNLFNNSVDAIGNSGGTIEVRSRTDPAGIAVEIEDDGIGIAEANLPRIFDPFYTTKPVGQGTGLGLSICYGIIKKLGGDIRVKSAKEKGTTFTVLLPVQDQPSSGSNQTAGSASAVQTASEYNDIKEVRS